MKHGHGFDKLKPLSKVKDILDVALEFEQTAHEFYAALSPKVSKNIRYLVDELAEEEQRHFDLFMALAQTPDIDHALNEAIATPASDRKFSDCVHAPDMGEHPDDQAVLQYALMREHIAMEQYTELAETTEPGPVQDLFRFLANEETKHKNELEVLYYDIVHSGGV